MELIVVCFLSIFVSLITNWYLWNGTNRNRMIAAFVGAIVVSVSVRAINLVVGISSLQLNLFAEDEVWLLYLVPTAVVTAIYRWHEPFKSYVDQKIFGINEISAPSN